MRNSEGGVEAAGAGKLVGLSEALQAETLAMLHERASELGYMKVIFETDAAVLKHSVNGKLGMHMTTQSLVLCFLKQNLNCQYASVIWCPRYCNSAAHKLASFGASLVDESICMLLNDVPNFASVAAASDLAGSTT